jgi:membrane protein
MADDESGDDWRAQVGKSSAPRSTDINRAREVGRGRQANTPEEIPSLGWVDIFWRVFWSISANRILTTAGGVAFFSLLAIFPAIGAIVSLYGLFTDARTIGEHTALLGGILPFGVLDIVTEQIKLVAGQQTDTLGAAFLIGLGIAVWSANSGMAALFDALNVVYDERENRSLLKLYATTFLFTLLGILFVIVAIVGLVIVPLVLSYVGLASVTENLISILRWPLLLVTVGVGLSFLYRYGPSRRNAKWRWVTWGSIVAALLWLTASMLFSWYVATFDSYNKVYGSLGAGIGFMVWLWISAVIVLLGGEINAEMEHQTARDTTEGKPKPLGARGATMADHVGVGQRRRK